MQDYIRREGAIISTLECWTRPVALNLPNAVAFNTIPHVAPMPNHKITSVATS